MERGGVWGKIGLGEGGVALVREARGLAGLLDLCGGVGEECVCARARVVVMVEGGGGVGEEDEE